MALAAGVAAERAVVARAWMMNTYGMLLSIRAHRERKTIAGEAVCFSRARKTLTWRERMSLFELSHYSRSQTLP